MPPPQHSAEYIAGYTAGHTAGHKEVLTALEQDIANLHHQLADRATTIAILTREIAGLRSQLALATSNQPTVESGNEAGNGPDNNSYYKGASSNHIGGSATSVSHGTLNFLHSFIITPAFRSSDLGG